MAQQMLDHITISGIDELNEAFRNMPENIVNKVVRKAVKNGATVFEWSMKRHAAKSRDTGELQRSITTVVKTYSSQNVVYAAIGPAWGEQRHAHLIEFGHKKPHSEERVAAQPYARPAEDQNAQAVARLLELELLKETERELNRILKAG